MYTGCFGREKVNILRKKSVLSQLFTFLRPTATLTLPILKPMSYSCVYFLLSRLLTLYLISHIVDEPLCPKRRLLGVIGTSAPNINTYASYIGHERRGQIC